MCGICFINSSSEGINKKFYNLVITATFHFISCLRKLNILSLKEVLMGDKNSFSFHPKINLTFSFFVLL